MAYEPLAPYLPLKSLLTPDHIAHLDRGIQDMETFVNDAVGNAGRLNDSAVTNLVLNTESSTTKALRDRYDSGVNPRAYGAIGDGVADDTTAIQAAIDAAPSGATVHLSPGVYRITGGITIGKSLRLVGYGATLDGRDIPTGSAYGVVCAIRVEGILGAAVTTSTPVPKWGKVISGLASTAAFSPGSLVLLRNEEQPVPGMTRVDRDKGELAIVDSVDSATQVRLTAGALFDYGATGLVLQPGMPVRGVTIEGVSVWMGGAGSFHNGIIVRHARDVTIDHVSVDGADDTAVSLFTTWNGRVTGCKLTNSVSPASSGGTGYGVQVAEGSRHCVVEGNQFYACRHFVAGGGKWPASFVDVVGNHGEKSFGAAYDCHESTFYWKFVSNTGVGVSSGFIIRGQHITVDGNEIVSTDTHAYKVATFDGVTEQRGIRLINNTSGQSMYGLVVDGRAAGAEPACVKVGVEIVGNTIRNSQGDGIFLAHFRGAVVSANTVENVASRGIYITGITGTPSTALALHSNRVSGSAWQGILVALINAATVSAGTVSAPGYSGLEFTSCNDVSINGFNVTAPGRYGLWVNASNRAVLSGVNISGGTGANYDAVRISGCSDISVLGGHVASPRFGVYSTTTDYVTVMGVNARTAAHATKISVDATNKVVTDNFG